MGAKAVWIQLTSAIYHPYVRPLTLEQECIPVAGHSGHSFSYRHGDGGCSGRNIRFDYPSSRALDMLRFLEYFRTPMEHLARFTQPLARRPRLSVPVIPMQMCDSLRLSHRWLHALHAVCGVMVSCFLVKVCLGGYVSRMLFPLLGQGWSLNRRGVFPPPGGNPLATPLPKRGRVRSLCQRPQ